MQIYWNRTLAWVFSCKFAAFSEHLFLKNTPGGLLLLSAMEDDMTKFWRDFNTKLCLLQFLEVEIFWHFGNCIWNFLKVNWSNNGITKKVMKYGNDLSVIFWKLATFLSQKYLEVFTYSVTEILRKSQFSGILLKDGWV